MTSSFFGAIEQAYIRRHIKAHEEAGTLIKTKEKKAKAPGLFQKLQAMAEQAQERQLKSDRGGGKGKGGRR